MGLSSRIVLILVSCAVLASCGDPPEAVVKAGFLPENPTVSVGMAFSHYPPFKSLLWDSYTDPNGQSVVKATAEYRLDLPEVAACPPTRDPGLVKAGRLFLEVRFLVDKKAKTFAYLDSRFLAYSPKGWPMAYPAGITALQAVLAGQPSIDCSMLYAPGP